MSAQHLRRCLFVIHYPVFGGPHNQALRLTDALRERGWETIVLLPREAGNAAQRLRQAGIEVVEVPLSRLRAARAFKPHADMLLRLPGDVSRLRHVIRSREIDLVLIGGLVNPHAAFAARLERTPVVWQILDTYAPRALRRALMPLVTRLADALMFDGEALIDAHAERRSLRVPWSVYYPPVDTGRFVASSDRRREGRIRLGVPSDAPLVGTVSNLSPQKGIEYFVRAAARVYAERSDAWFVVVGGTYATHAAYTARVQAEIGHSQIPSRRFKLVGEHADVECFYPAFDVKVIASVPRSEGTTTTALEAMACGIPVVATDVGAVAEVVDNERTGVLVPPLDPEAMAAAILKLLSNDDRRSMMAREGRRRAVERYGVATCADAHVEAFEVAVQRRAARATGSGRG